MFKILLSFSHKDQKIYFIRGVNFLRQLINKKQILFQILLILDDSDNSL